MTVTDIASRTYNHGWRLDPIVRSLLDTDFYKLLMLQMIRRFYPDEHVTFSVINRTHHVRLGDVIDEGELRAQLDQARSDQARLEARVNEARARVESALARLPLAEAVDGDG